MFRQLFFGCLGSRPPDAAPRVLQSEETPLCLRLLEDYHTFATLSAKKAAITRQYAQTKERLEKKHPWESHDTEAQAVRDAELFTQSFDQSTRETQAVLDMIESAAAKATDEPEKSALIYREAKRVLQAKIIDQQHQVIHAELKLTMLKLMQERQAPPPAKESEKDFALWKKIVIQPLEHYISPIKFALFGHHHNARAETLRDMILAARTKKEVQYLLRHQMLLFNLQSMPLPQGIFPGDNHALALLHQRPNCFAKGGFYAALREALQIAASPPAETMSLQKASGTFTPALDIPPTIAR